MQGVVLLSNDILPFVALMAWIRAARVKLLYGLSLAVTMSALGNTNLGGLQVDPGMVKCVFVSIYTKTLASSHNQIPLIAELCCRQGLVSSSVRLY